MLYYRSRNDRTTWTVSAGRSIRSIGRRRSSGGRLFRVGKARMIDFREVARLNIDVIRVDVDLHAGPVRWRADIGFKLAPMTVPAGAALADWNLHLDHAARATDRVARNRAQPLQYEARVVDSRRRGRGVFIGGHG